MKHTIAGLVATGSFCLLCACGSVSQRTSGADYLTAYSDPAYQHSWTDLDEDIREIAAIEPNLRFPARIGLARIDPSGELVNLPAEEGLAWQGLGEKLGPEFGAFVPVSPLIAATVAAGPVRNGAHGDLKQTLANIRRGAARQHIDYVLVYEVGVQDERAGNILGFGNLTVLGLFVLPSVGIEVEAVSSALLMDVRNGYPYAMITEYTQENGVSSVSRARKREDRLTKTATLKAVEALVAETDLVIRGLARQQNTRPMPENEPQEVASAWWDKTP